MKRLLGLLFLATGIKAPALPAEIRLHAEAQTSLAARLTSLKNVNRQLDIESFYLENDRIGRGLLKQIFHAKQERPALQIRLLLDAWGSEAITENMICEIFNAGISVKLFNKSSGIFNQQRTHRKIWIADDLAFIGGRNLSEENFSTQALSDWDVEVRGEIVTELKNSFDQAWAHKLSVSPDCGPAASLQAWTRVINGEPKLPLSAEAPAAWQTADVQWHADPVGENGKRPVRAQAVALIGAARASIEIENAFFLPVGPIADELGKARKKNVRFQFYLNGPDTKFWMAKYSTCLPLNEIQWWMDGGAKVVFTPQHQKTHAKSLFIDDHTLAIGSFNLDARSININAETLLIIRNSPEIFNSYRVEHERRMSGGLQTNTVGQVFEKYRLTEGEIQECSGISNLKPLLKNFF